MDKFTPEEIAILKQIAQERIAEQGGGAGGAPEEAPAGPMGDMGADLAAMLGGGGQ